MVMTSSRSVGVRPGMIGLGGSRAETSMALARASASSLSTSSLHGHSSSCSKKISNEIYSSNESKIFW